VPPVSRVELRTIRKWVERLGYEVVEEDPRMLRITPPEGRREGVPPFYVQLAEHWLMLSILPIFPADRPLAGGTALGLLLLTRDMPIAKFATGEDGEVVLCAELPTESLQEVEVTDLIERMVGYVRTLPSRMLGLDYG